MFGQESLFFNNLAWMLRKFPIFAVPGNGKYRIQPIYVDDVAELAVRAGHKRKNLTIDAGGPETFTFDEMIALLEKRIGSHARIIHVRPERALQLSGLIGGAVNDVPLTRKELDVLTSDLLIAPGRPAGHTLFSSWLARHADTLGSSYHSELARHFN